MICDSLCVTVVRVDGIKQRTMAQRNRAHTQCKCKRQTWEERTEREKNRTQQEKCLIIMYKSPKWHYKWMIMINIYTHTHSCLSIFCHTFNSLSVLCSRYGCVSFYGCTRSLTLSLPFVICTSDAKCPVWAFLFSSCMRNSIIWCNVGWMMCLFSLSYPIIRLHHQIVSCVLCVLLP